MCVAIEGVGGSDPGAWLGRKETRKVLVGGLNTDVLVAAVLIECVAAVIQGVLGFGLNVMAGPFLVLLDHHFVPVPLLVMSLGASGLVLARERSDLDKVFLGLGTAGRIPGTVAGLLVLKLMAARALTVVFGCMVLCAVGLSMVHRGYRASKGAVAGTGVVSGVFSTVGGLGGIPFGLLLRNMPGGSLRATVSALALVGSLLSLVALSVSGYIGSQELELAGVLLPGMLIGFAISSRVVGRVDARGWIRTLVLVIAGAGAMTGIVHGLVA